MEYNPRVYSFIGGNWGAFHVTTQRAIVGPDMPNVTHVEIEAGWRNPELDGFVIHGAISNERYVTRSEKDALSKTQEPLGRPSADRSAMVLIQKHEQWWNLAPDQRRQIMEQRSRHIAIGATYLPQIARRLHHCRDLPWREPFDFVTWFEFASVHESMFDELLAQLRASEEWTFVTREVEFRMWRQGWRKSG